MCFFVLFWYLMNNVRCEVLERQEPICRTILKAEVGDHRATDLYKHRFSYSRLSEDSTINIYINPYQALLQASFTMCILIALILLYIFLCKILYTVSLNNEIYDNQ